MKRMSRQTTVTHACFRKGGSSSPPNIPAAALSQRDSDTPGDALLQQQYRELIHKHLDKLINVIFAEFTGLHFRISWAPLLPRKWDDQTLPTGRSACCRLAAARPQPWAGCRTCGPHHLAIALKSRFSHRFTCSLGVRNDWFPIRVRGETLGIAYLQALDSSTVRPIAERFTRATRGPFGWSSARVLSPVEFARAARLLKFIVQHVQTASLADLRKADLTNARQTVLTLATEQARLHNELKRILPASTEPQPVSTPESHAKMTVHRLLESIDREYGKPIRLQQYADRLGMNAAYLSGVFSRVIGLPFKTYLTELRLEKAKELLSDATKTVSEVAFAVGYTGENRFRLAFKQATGLSPKRWRMTMRVNSPRSSPKPFTSLDGEGGCPQAGERRSIAFEVVAARRFILPSHAALSIFHLRKT